MTVTAIDRLLFYGEHPAEDLRRALSIDAMSPGWKGSFQSLFEAQQRGPVVGNPGLSRASQEPWQGFRPLCVLSNELESPEVRSIRLGAPTGEPLPPFLPGQHVVLRTATQEGETLIRSYSLSGDPADGSYRISIKREPGGTGSSHLQDHLQRDTTIETSAPRGTFTLDESSKDPIVLLSAGVGVTPLLSMLHALSRTDRKVFWIHGARDGSSLTFQEEVALLLRASPDSKRLIALSRPAEGDVHGRDYDVEGRLDMNALDRLEIPARAGYYICGPADFITSFRNGLQEAGVDKRLIRSESFGEPLSPESRAEPISPSAGAHYRVTLTRSNRVLNWSEAAGSLLELAEAESVAVPFACRVGVCHRCENGLLAGGILYEPQPLDPPARGRVLLCCARPTSDLVLDV